MGENKEFVVCLPSFYQTLGIRCLGHVHLDYYCVLKSTRNRGVLQGNQGKMLFNMNLVSLRRFTSETQNDRITEQSLH